MSGSLGYRRWMGFVPSQFRWLSSLRFGQLSCEWEAMDQEFENLLRKLHGLCLGSRVHQIPRTPEMLAYQGQTIRERRLSLVIPGGHWERNLAIVAQPQGQQGDEREQSEQDRGGASNRLVRPLALGFQPELGSPLRKGDLDRPAHDDPRQDLPRGRLQVSTEIG
jgi:hypothetical protein